MDNESDIYQPTEGEERSENVEISRENIGREEEQTTENVVFEGQPQENIQGEDQLAEAVGGEEVQTPVMVEADPEGQLMEAVGLNAIEVSSKHFAIDRILFLII